RAKFCGMPVNCGRGERRDADIPAPEDRQTGVSASRRASVLGKSAPLHSHARMSSTHRRHFASDNYAGCTPEAWAAMDEARQGHAPGYGDDAWTERASNLLRELFE